MGFHRLKGLQSYVYYVFVTFYFSGLHCRIAATAFNFFKNNFCVMTQFRVTPEK